MSSSIIGQTLGNKYEILELLGRGGMATVYKGYQADIDRYVAIKVLAPQHGHSDEFVQRFQLEARTIARLQHPHILPVYDYGTQGDVLYLAVAYIASGSLADRIDGGPMPLRQIERYLREVAAALDYAHRQNIIHRDIKPDNILINSEGYSVLSDFGIAKLVGADDSRLTATGGLVGTPAYMAPEQVHGGEIGPATDIYALGVVTYEMLTGRQPYMADTPLRTVMMHVTEPVPRLSQSMSGFPPALESVMLRVMAKDPVDRYRTATDFAESFSKAIEDVAGSPTMDSPPETLILQDTKSLMADASTTASAANSETSPTIIVQSPTNTLLLLGGLAIIALLVVAIAALVIFTLNQNEAPPTPAPTATVAVAQVTAAPTFGRATFNSTQSLGDTLNLRVEGLRVGGGGSRYVVWLIGPDSETPVNVGTVNVDALGNGVFSYTDAEGRFLPGMFNQVVITREQDADVETPSGEVTFRGEYPVSLANALTAILVESADGIDGASLETSVLAEAELGERHGNLAAESGNLGGMLTHVEHTINILQGTEDDFNSNGRGENPSSAKLGVPYFLDLIEAQLDEALADPGTTLQIQAEAELIRVCIENARFTLDNVLEVQDALLAAESVEAVAEERAESVRLLNVLVNGEDLNSNDQIEPFEGECSLVQIETYGVLAGAIDIVEG